MISASTFIERLSMPQERTERRTQAERSLETRERIIRASIELLHTRGFAGFRVADVTEVAGVSRGAQSHHFHSKAELVLAVFKKVFEEASEQSLARIASVGPGDDVVAAMVTDAAAFFLGENFAIGLDLLGAADRDPELRVEVQEIARDTRTMVESMWLEELGRRGLSADAAEDVLWLVFSMIRGLAVRLLWQYDGARFERVKQLAYEAAQAVYLHGGGVAAPRPHMPASL
jgi:AcrR family transcriptional regulator